MKVQAHLGGIVGSVPDYHNKASYAIFLVSQWIYNLFFTLYYRATHAQGQGQRPEELPGAMAARAQEGLEELSHVEGQEGQRWEDTPRPR